MDTLVPTFIATSLGSMGMEVGMPQERMKAMTTAKMTSLFRGFRMDAPFR
jgi:hypothetical protein